MRELARTRLMAVVLAVHDFTLGALCADRMAFLHDRRLHKVGTPGEVPARTVLTKVYGGRLDVVTHPTSCLPMVLPAFSERVPDLG